jgi:hypothetical protein
MNYSVSLLTTKPDCQAVLDLANESMADFNFRKISLTRQKENSSGTAVNIEADLAEVTAELAGLQIALDSLPEGPYKQETLGKFKKADTKKFLLEQRKENYGVINQVGKEFDIACVEKSIIENQVYIDALTVRLNELP